MSEEASDAPEWWEVEFVTTDVRQLAPDAKTADVSDRVPGVWNLPWTLNNTPECLDADAILLRK